ncbi:MAG: GTPase domain-containing protein [Planctomycetia bacterium]|nr:GTPase domain-containing protein [Planctomycetia bacterium]
MNDELAALAGRISQLDRALAELRGAAGRLGVAPLDGREWFELLKHKLLPQLEGEPWLVVAVVGGTNIGKSLIFNTLAGETASAVSPLASRTRHAVCLVPEHFADESVLSRLFEGFLLRAWQSPEDAHNDESDHYLFWRVGKNVPPRLLLLDTPDIDSDVRVNWQRADHVRQAADVLIAVLTQQKYNDAAVKQFFRKAADADKPVVLVFNQCDLAEDRGFWPLWQETFCGETGVRPELVYVLPYDRSAARGLALPFYDVGRDGLGAPAAPSSLRDELANLHFSQIKLRTLRGALRELLDPARGAPAYLEELRAAGTQFADAAGLMSGGSLAQVRWPALPTRLLVSEIHAWWDERRGALARGVHGFYRAVGAVVTYPLWAALGYVRPTVDAVETFRRDERAAVVLAVEALVRELERLKAIGNETLRPRLERLLAGKSRVDLLSRVQAAHEELPPVDEDFRRYLHGELDAWAKEFPRTARTLSILDQTAAAARPALTVTLAVTGWLLAGGLVHDMAAQAVGHTVTHVAADAAIVVGGDLSVTTAGTGLKHALAQLFRRLQAHYAKRRADWLAAWLERELLGSLLVELREGAETSQSQAFVRTKRLLAELAEAQNAVTT